MSRFDYIKYDGQSLNEQMKAKDLCIQMEAFINSLGYDRPVALALTRLEEVYMWIGKSIRDRQIERSAIGVPPDLQEERG